MMRELDAARVVLKAARRVVDGDDIGALRRALEIHEGLVDDREPPSARCGGTECSCAGGAAGGHDRGAPRKCQVEHDHWEGKMICGNPLPCRTHGGG
jgi:hypothetical protein